MKTKKWYIITVVMLLIAALTAAPLAAFAYDGPPYTATLKYYDNIQITYTLKYPTEGVWSGAGDIPIGGMGGVTSQIYCVDPFVHFHSMAETSWPGGVTTDTMGGYTIAAPWTVSAAMIQNADAVRWLVANGYSGDYLKDDSVSKESVQWLIDNSHIANIDAAVALMATKIAIWKTLAGDDVTILSTSLDSDPTRKAALNSLITWMVSAAQGGGSPSKAITNFTVTIEKPGDSSITPGGAYNYYGPMTVTAELQNARNPETIPELLDKVFLTVSGPDSGGIVFTDEGKDPLAPVNQKIYGTNVSAPYLEGSKFIDDGGVWKSEPFYMRIPAGRDPEYGDLLTVKAMAMVKDVELVAGTPVTFIYEKSGVHDWDYVQAYAGAANDGMTMDLYAQDQINTGETSLGQLYVSKRVENGSPLDNDLEFRFELFMGTDKDRSNAVPVDMKSHPVHLAARVEPGSNPTWFTLKNGGLAMIDGLPADPGYFYWLEEAADSIPDGYEEPKYEIFADDSEENSGTGNCAGWFQIEDADFASALVMFTNTRESERAHLYVGKYALAFDSSGEADTHITIPFNFKIEYLDGDGVTWLPFNLAGVFMGDGGSVVSAVGGEFKLQSTGMAVIELKPDRQYRITEADPGHQEFTPMYAFVHTDEDGGFVSDESHVWSDADSGPYAIEEIEAESGHYYYLVFTNKDIKTYDLELSKAVSGSVPASARERQFQFKVFYMGDTPGWPVPLTTDPGAANAMYVEGVSQDQIKNDSSGGSTVLTLKAEQTAVIKDLPVGRYMVSEVPVSGFSAKYIIGQGDEKTARNGETEVFLLNEYGMAVTFTNAYSTGGGGDKPEKPSTTEEPSVPEKPDGAEKPETPSTPDGAGQIEAPKPTVTGHSLVRDGDGYIELDENGVPLGRWTWDEENGVWIFDDGTPLGNIPGTGGTGAPICLFIFLFAAMICIDFLRRFDNIKGKLE